METDQGYKSRRTVDQINYSTTRMKYSTEGTRTAVISKNADVISFTGNNVKPNALKTTLTHATLGSDTTQIPPSGFIDCENLSEVNVPLKCKTVSEYAFKGCSKLKDTNILSGGEYSVQLIGNHAFDGCNGLENIKINLKGTDSTSYHIGEYAFANCNSLKNVSWEKWSYLGEHMFSGCTSLTSLNIPNNTNYIFPYCLAGIPNIKSITIPSKIWMLNDFCFQNDTSLTSVTIEDSKDGKSVLDHVGNSIFDGCTNLTTMTFPEVITDMSCFEPYTLSGSNVSRVVMSGMDDEKFVTNYKERFEFENTGYIRSLTEFKKIQENIVNHNVPVVFFTNSEHEDKITGGCQRCQDLRDAIKSEKWKQYM